MDITSAAIANILAIKAQKEYIFPPEPKDNLQPQKLRLRWRFNFAAALGPISRPVQRKRARQR